MMSVQTPKRPTLPPLTPSSYGAAPQKMTLPPLSEVLKSVSFSSQLPPRIMPNFGTSPQTPMPTDTPLRKPSVSIGNDSFESDDSMDRSVSEIVSSKPAKTSYAFISHSPSTFPLQCPTIDNASLARRRRRRTSPAELAILNAEYQVGSTPNKLRRLDIALKVNMDEKAVQVWFQNKRQHMRKQANQDREVTELPMVTSTPSKPLSMRMLGDSIPSLPKRTASSSALPSPRPHITHGNLLGPLTGLLPRQALCPDLFNRSENRDEFILNEIKRHSPKHDESPPASHKRFKLMKSVSAASSSAVNSSAQSANSERVPLGEISTNKRHDIAQNLLSLKSGNWA